MLPTLTMDPPAHSAAAAQHDKFLADKSSQGLLFGSLCVRAQLIESFLGDGVTEWSSVVVALKTHHPLCLGWLIRSLA
jgi:hypothetical protein